MRIYNFRIYSVDRSLYYILTEFKRLAVLPIFYLSSLQPVFFYIKVLILSIKSFSPTFRQKRQMRIN